MGKVRRPFNLDVLAKLSEAPIKPLIGIGAVVWRYTVLVPKEETASGKASKRIATDEDLTNGALAPLSLFNPREDHLMVVRKKVFVSSVCQKTR